MFAISLPSVVGLAGWPCVRDSIGNAANSCAMARNDAITPSSAGSSVSARASLSISACDTLLMSSDVHAKWMNSDTPVTSALFASRSFSQYSIAFTS